ncbi:hypothetical protein [Phormidium sp. FACHB-1136]|uniref:hypothetical protein n=1 Tax=Phormidium sp. FACHB-1136 TaxID=2692848 RepID=UPI001683F3B7|nr:hypothetical protein [Phormidium sp. FACHB-1136]
MDELRSALDLATEEELQALTELLFRPKFNPLDYLNRLDPLEVQSGSRQQWLDRLEQRFRFLAADGFTVLHGQSQAMTYRQALIQVCRYLRLPYTEAWPTEDLEAEVFLHLIESAWQKLPPGDRQQVQRDLQKTLAQSPQFQTLPKALQANPTGLLVKGGSALVVSSLLRPWLLHHLSRQVMLQVARYEVAKQALVRGGGTALAQIQSRVALGMASRGVAVNAARYGATRTLLAWLGPALWAWFFADLGWRTIATNYGRVIPVVFTLAQIRLSRSLSEWESAPC